MKTHKLDIPPLPNLPPKRGLVVGTGRCGTTHLAKLYRLLFSKYVWASHEVVPTYAGVVGKIYDKKDFTSVDTLKLAREKWIQLMGRTTILGNSPIHRWVESSAFLVPLIYQLLTIDPKLKLIVMIRHPEDFVRSCKAMLESDDTDFFGKKGFIWDRIGSNRFKEAYGQYWLECMQAIRQQLHWLHKEPDLIMFTDAYGDGKYIRQMLRLWDIPETEDNIQQATWLCKERAINPAGNREAWDEAKIPDLEFCKPEWDWWEERYGMVEEE